MGVPEGLKALLSDLGVSGRVHEEHTKQHDMSCYPASLCVVDLDGGKWAELDTLHVEEVDIVCRDVYNGPEKQAVRDLAMEPDILI
jgi:hypothetical protein